MSFASVTIIMACLIIMGSVSLLSVNIDALIQDLEDQNEIVTFVDESLSEKEARAIESELEAVENVSSVEFVSREEAMTNYMGKHDASLMEEVDHTDCRQRKEKQQPPRGERHHEDGRRNQPLYPSPLRD